MLSDDKTISTLSAKIHKKNVLELIEIFNHTLVLVASE